MEYLTSYMILTMSPSIHMLNVVRFMAVKAWLQTTKSKFEACFHMIIYQRNSLNNVFSVPLVKKRNFGDTTDKGNYH